ncbi:MAG: DUF839 domain-containing protein [Acidobacteriota bacterium]|nr:MAG: DUF839 domain-containing protein [Acidobacteriota bacterium]
MSLSRRAFLGTGAAAGAALAFHRLVLRGDLYATGRYGDLIAKAGEGAYGPLHPGAAKNTGEMLLAVPEGFEYNVFGRTGDKMADGRPTPRSHDGMAAFEVGSELRLVRNHEINNGLGAEGVTLGGPDKSYDRLAGGGTTTLVIDPETRELKRDFVSLSGSLHNCAGGPTPWGSWITCEETVLGKRRFRDMRMRERGGFAQDHGYCFEVPASMDVPVDPVPLKAMGRFVHEAVAVDPETGIVYETEDRGSAGFYRFIPARKGFLSEGGRLQMLAVRGTKEYDTRSGQKQGQTFDVVWVDIDEPDSPNAENDELCIYKQGLSKGGATFARLEGCWYGGGSIFFTATSGGDRKRGQVWRYTPRGDEGGILKLLFESPDEAVLRGPDNLCVSPRGGLVICEDGGGENFMRGLTPEGQIFDMARNMIKGFENREFAGATFSPDGRTLFFNIQTPGLTFALWGPWGDGAL